MSFRKEQRRGFTLVELSIVLVIIGLLTGAVIVGKSLVRQSKINTIATDAQRYTQAALNFQQKYNGLPGDLATATTYWSGTANGDGNGQIATSGGSGATVSTVTPSEFFLFWQHLVDAQLIEGNYSGVAGSAGNQDHVIGTNCPESRISAGGFGVIYIGVKSGSTNYFDNSYGHVFLYGGYNSNDLPDTAIITGAEAYKIDTKFDDGLPVSGKIMSWKQSGTYVPGCTTASDTTSTYNTTTGGNQCSLIFLTGF